MPGVFWSRDNCYRSIADYSAETPSNTCAFESATAIFRSQIEMIDMLWRVIQGTWLLACDDCAAAPDNCRTFAHSFVELVAQ